MSIAQFSSLVKTHIYEGWLTRFYAKVSNAEDTSLANLNNNVEVSLAKFKTSLYKIQSDTRELDRFSDVQKDQIIAILDKLINKTQQYAKAATEMDAQLYSGYEKDARSFAIHVGIVEFNDPKPQLGKLIKAAAFDVAQEVIKQPAFIKGLVETESSPSLVNMFAQDLAAIITSGIRNNTKYSEDKIKIAKPKLNFSKAGTTKAVEALKQAKSKVIKSKKPQLRDSKGHFSSLTTLMRLLNTNLHDQIQKNMGTGQSTNVLNYRTGRFAHSAQVQRLTWNRQDLITVFYNYMTYPYATFSAGGRQQYPRSRDPKLLISKSIKEIAATQYKQQIRQVLEQ